MKVVGVEKVDGVDATHVSGDVVAGDATADDRQAVRAEARDGGGRAGVPANVQQSAKSAVKKVAFDAWVGSDRVVRRMRIVVRARRPEVAPRPG